MSWTTKPKQVTAYEIDTNGFILHSLLVFDSNTQSNIIKVDPPSTLYKPKWDSTNSVWIEGETADNILQNAKNSKITELSTSYSTDLISPVTTTLVWTDGLNVVFDYEEKDQLNYSKRANTLSLDSTITSFEIGSRSHGAITITRDQFLQIMGDFDNHEMTLYKKLDGLRTQVNNCTTVADVNLVVW